MRIAYLSTDRGIAYGGAKGASVHVEGIVRALAAERAHVLLLVASVVPGAGVPDGVAVERLPDPIDDRWLAHRLAEFGADAVYERLALHTDQGARVARLLGVPFLVELNAPLLEEAARFRTLMDPAGAAELEANTLRSADLVLAVSPPLADYAAARGARRVEVNQNAADIERFPPTGRTAGPARAVFAGSLRPWHGLETIAAAWRRLGATAPALHVIGDGPARYVLEAVPGVEFSGYVPAADVPALLSRADIALAPYGRDTPRYFSPIKLFEYLAAGLPTIVGDLPAVSEVVDGDSAVVIPAGDAIALASAVVALAADPAERRRLGDNGRELIARGHTWRHRAQRVRDAIAELAPSAIRT